MTVSVINEKDAVEQTQKMVDDNLLIFLDENRDQVDDEESSSSQQTHNEDSVPIYFRYNTYFVSLNQMLSCFIILGA